MCLASGPSTPAAPKAVAPAPTQQNYTNTAEVIDSASASRQRVAAAQGFQSTIKTGSSGLADATTSKKTLLGQ